MTCSIQFNHNKLKNFRDKIWNNKRSEEISMLEYSHSMRIIRTKILNKQNNWRAPFQQPFKSIKQEHLSYSHGAAGCCASVTPFSHKYVTHEALQPLFKSTLFKILRDSDVEISHLALFTCGLRPSFHCLQ